MDAYYCERNCWNRSGGERKLLITCGSGRYDRLGFSLDFNNKGKYLNYLKIQNLKLQKILILETDKNLHIIILYLKDLFFQRSKYLITINQ